jgi:hypothetical protein
MQRSIRASENKTRIILFAEDHPSGRCYVAVEVTEEFLHAFSGLYVPDNHSRVIAYVAQ